MKRIDVINKYIKDEFCMKELDLFELKREIDGELTEDYTDIKNSQNPSCLIGLYAIIKYNITSIGMGCLNRVYNNRESFYFFEQFYYHVNLMALINYMNNKEYGFSLSLYEQGEILLMNFACDDFRIGHLCYDVIRESITSGKMAKSLPMYTRPQKLGVLAIEMLASEKNQKIDWDRAGIPVDPFYQRFCQEALYNENHDILTQWLILLCDKHVECSALFGMNSDEQRSTGYEIDMEILLAWPFEYQAIKNFRARHGLATPEIDHPLLKTPMAIEHRPDMVSWKQHMPAVYYHITDDLIALNPEFKVIHTLF